MKTIIKKIQNKPLLYAIQVCNNNEYLYTAYSRNKTIATNYCKRLK